MAENIDEAGGTDDAPANDGTGMGSTWKEYTVDSADVAVATALVNAAAAADPSISELQINGLIGDAAKGEPSVRHVLLREVGCIFLYRLRVDVTAISRFPGQRLSRTTRASPVSSVRLARSPRMSSICGTA